MSQFVVRALISIFFFVTANPLWAGSRRPQSAEQKVDKQAGKISPETSAGSNPPAEKKEAKQETTAQNQELATYPPPRTEKNFLDDPLVKKIHKRQARRRNALNALKMKGVVGEAETGLIKIRDATSLKKDAKEKMEKLVSAENKDREIVINKIGTYENYSPADEKLLRLKLFEAYIQYDGDQTYFYKNDRWQQR